MKKKLLTVLVFIFCVIGFAQSQVLGRIEYLEGSVEIMRDGVPLTRVDIGTKIENLDQLKTSKDGMATIAFDKETGLTGTLQIVSNSSALIRLDQISGTKTNEVKLMAGSVNLKIKRLAGVRSAAQVRTSSAVLGVRGTEFVVASFNATSLVACKEGEVICYAASELTGTISHASAAASVPGTLVEILESGSVNTGRFPEGNFETNWDIMRNKWKSFQEELIVENPLPLIEQLVPVWTKHSAAVEVGASRLKKNAVLKNWLKNPKKPEGTFADWVKERPIVMKDLINIRGDMVLATITWYRLEELIPLLPTSVMDQKLSSGQTVKAFIKDYSRSSKTVSEAVGLFYAAEKQYMLRNDGSSPFMDF